MGNMTKTCKEMNFLSKKKTNFQEKINNVKETKSEFSPPLPNLVQLHPSSPSKKEENLEEKFNDENFNEKDFENSFHSQMSKPDVLNCSSLHPSDDYFSEADLIFYKEKFKNEESKTSKKMLKSRKIRWKEGEQLGMGSFGTVVLGFNKETGELMAVKQVHLIGFNTSQERIKALEIEFNLLSLLKHKNIVRYIGTTKNKETFNIFLEFVAGGSISSLLSKYGSFKENIVRLYTKQILEGLEYLHWNDVLHRDIKGANVLVDNNGICKLADFGSAKRICGILENERYHSLSGTANWMAPEVIKQTGATRFADIWSVGCTVVEMITAKPPFAEYRNPISAMFHIAKAKSPPSVPEDISPIIHDFLEKCFKQVPHERYNVRKLLDHPFIKGEVEILHIQPTLDITKEKEKKILENFEESKEENKQIEQISFAENSSVDFSKQIIEKSNLNPVSSILVSKSTVKDKQSENEEIEKNDINEISEQPHIKLPTLEDQSRFSIEENNIHKFESANGESINGENLNKTIHHSESSDFNQFKSNGHNDITGKKEKIILDNSIEHHMLNKNTENENNSSLFVENKLEKQPITKPLNSLLNI